METHGFNSHNVNHQSTPYSLKIRSSISAVGVFDSGRKKKKKRKQRINNRNKENNAIVEDKIPTCTKMDLEQEILARHS